MASLRSFLIGFKLDGPRTWISSLCLKVSSENTCSKDTLTASLHHLMNKERYPGDDSVLLLRIRYPPISKKKKKKKRKTDYFERDDTTNTI